MGASDRLSNILVRFEIIAKLNDQEVRIGYVVGPCSARRYTRVYLYAFVVAGASGGVHSSSMVASSDVSALLND